MQLSKYSNDILFLVEPYFHGVQYIDVARKNNCEFVILRRENGPIIEDNNNENIIVDLFNTNEVIKTIKKRLLKKHYTNIGILPGNDFCVPIVAELNEKLNLRSNSVQASISTRNKIVMRELLYKGNVNSPKSMTFRSLENIVNAKDKFIFPLVVKPPDMTGSLFVKLVKNYSELLSASKEIFNIKNNVLNYPIDKAVMVEEYVEGPEFSVELFLENGKPLFSSVTEKHKNSLPYFIEIGHVVPSSITTKEENNLLVQTAMNAALALGVKYGPIHAEMVLTKSGPSIIEIASRIGGDNIMKLVNLACNVYMPQLAVDQVLNYDFKNSINKNFARGAAIKFITTSSGKITSIDGIDDIKNNKNVIDLELYYNVGDIINQTESGDERFGSIITIGKDGNEAYKLACELESFIKITFE